MKLAGDANGLGMYSESDGGVYSSQSKLFKKKCVKNDL